MSHLVFVLLALILIAATVLPMTNLRPWWVRGNDFPRLLYASLLTALLVVLLLWQGGENAPSPLWGLLLGACLVRQLLWIWPYSTVHEHEVPTAEPALIADAPRLKILISNVLMENRNHEALVAQVQRLQPDVVVTVETDAWWQERLDEALVDWPHRVACPLDNRYGMHLYSKIAFDEQHVDYLVEDDIPSMGVRFRLADDEPIRFHAVHPTPPAPGENPRSTERDVELLMLADALEGSDERIVVTGDLNDVAWSRTTQLFRRKSGLLDPRVGRGMFNTFHAGHRFLRWPLDHVFLSSHFRIVEMRRLASIGSDHFPVFIDIVLGEPVDLETHPELDDVDTELEQDTRETAAAAQASSPSLGTRVSDGVAYGS